MNRDKAAAAVSTQEYLDKDSGIKEMPVPYLSASSQILSLNAALSLRKAMQFTMQSRNGETTLKMWKFC